MRKKFAWLEVAAAVVLAVSAVIGYIRIQFDETVGLVRKLSIAAENCNLVAVNGKDCFESAWKTIPHWRQALIAGKNGVAGIKKTCDACTEKMWVPAYPKGLRDACLHLKQIPLNFSKSCEEVGKGLEKSIQLLNKNMSESEYQKTVQSFDRIIDSLESAQNNISGIQRSIQMHSLICLIAILAMSICFFSNGIICILEEKTETTP